ncbi:hypothetical protein [Halalkalibaculum sp. DA384]|uniref:hypothetical protein n=1 Tax=Halalkalibaculum sp. DA384 TaxID=3373606 RepID=UPI00375460A0
MCEQKRTQKVNACNFAIGFQEPLQNLLFCWEVGCTTDLMTLLNGSTTPSERGIEDFSKPKPPMIIQNTREKSGLNIRGNDSCEKRYHLMEKKIPSYGEKDTILFDKRW